MYRVVVISCPAISRISSVYSTTWCPVEWKSDQALCTLDHSTRVKSWYISQLGHWRCNAGPACWKHTALDHLYNRSANYGPKTKLGLPTIFINKVFMEYSHVFSLHIVYRCFCTTMQSCVTENYGLQILKYLPFSHLQKSCWFLIFTNRYRGKYICPINSCRPGARGCVDLFQQWQHIWNNSSNWSQHLI